MKILIIQQKMIGDVLTSSILFEALKKKFPDSELHYLINKSTLAVVENNPFIDHFLLFDPERDESLKGFQKFLKQMKSHKYDVVIDVYSKMRTAFISTTSGAEKRISYRKWYTSSAYTHTIPLNRISTTIAGLAVENRMRLLRFISEDFPLEIKPKIYLTSEERESALEILTKAQVSSSRPLIMCGILGSSKDKTYPLPYMARVLDLVVQRTDAQLLFNYIPNQTGVANRLLSHCKAETRKNVLFDVFGKNLRDFLALTSHCDALIGNEGGAVNMAKALDIPTFSIFSPQIRKESWSLYEDGIQNVSVHVADYKSRSVNTKELKKKSAEFYEEFKPALFENRLLQFLDQLQKIEH